jgi:hypothetical protein
MRGKTKAQRHTVDLAIPRHVISEVGSSHGSRWDAGIFHVPGKFGETLRTSVSAANTKDYGVSILLNLLP